MIVTLCLQLIIAKFFLKNGSFGDWNIFKKFFKFKNNCIFNILLIVIL